MTDTIPEGALSLHDDDLCIMHKGEIRFLLRLDFSYFAGSLVLPLDTRRFLLSRALASHNRTLAQDPPPTTTNSIPLARQLYCQRCSGSEPACRNGTLPMFEWCLHCHASLELDALSMTVEEGNEIATELAYGLAWATGDPQPKTCSRDCKIPHPGPRAKAACHAARDAVEQGLWNPPLSTSKELKSLFSALFALTIRVDELEAQAQKGKP